MEWRCEWCGKPHESDDPPCDNCGHHKFEKAVERVTASNDGSEHGPVWACTDCGREHQKHSPPCSRCGNVELEKRQPDYSDLEDLGGTSFFDVLEPRYAAGYLAVAVLGGVLVLGMAGIVTLPVVGGQPAPPDASGHGESYENVSLSTVEEEYVDALNERRESVGAGPLTTDEQMTEIATYYNKRVVESEYDDASAPTTDELAEKFEISCDRSPRLVPDVVPAETVQSAWSGENASASTVAATLTERSADELTSPDYDTVGIDVHVTPDDDVYVTLLLC